MASRVISADLKEIIATNKSDSVLDSQFIETANVIVEEHLAASGLSDALLEKIELYLAAHFLALSEERGALISDHHGDATERYANVYSGGLKSTRFGQTAIALDNTGTLQKFDTKKFAQFRIIST